MSRAKGDRGLDGFVVLRKPAGPTSHDVVARVRRLLSTRRVGHAGTLDPLAEGVLPLAIGRATRLLDLLAEADKEYLALVELGLRTATDDAEGEILSRVPVDGVSTVSIDRALEQFRGAIAQRPPGYSAIKVDGRRAYALARAGQTVTLPPRQVTIERLERLSWSPPLLELRIQCSKGTYIRALARDLGEVLQVGGTLRRLERTRVGPFGLDRAVTLDEMAERGEAALLPPDALLGELPAVRLTGQQVEDLLHGRSWESREAANGLARAYTPEGVFAGVLTGQDGRWRTKLLFLDEP